MYVVLVLVVVEVVEDVSDLRRVTTVIVAYSRALPSNIMLTTQSSSISVDLMRVFLLMPVLPCWPDNIKTDICHKTRHVG